MQVNFILFFPPCGSISFPVAAFPMLNCCITDHTQNVVALNNSHFVQDSAGQQLGLGSAGHLFCWSQLESLLWLQLPGRSTGLQRLRWPHSQVWGLGLAAGWAMHLQQSIWASSHDSSILKPEASVANFSCNMFAIVPWPKQVTWAIPESKWEGTTQGHGLREA